MYIACVRTSCLVSFGVNEATIISIAVCTNVRGTAMLQGRDQVISIAVYTNVRGTAMLQGRDHS